MGRPLVALNAERYAREADLRFALVRVNEYAAGISLYGGEADERRVLDEPVDRVVTVMARLAGGLARLTWITSGYGWLAIVVPIIVAAPGYFDGELSFGTLMMVVGAFNQVQSSLRWFVDNLAQIADLRATLLRIVAFRDALPEVDTIGEEAGRIAVVDAGSDQLVLEGLAVALPDACVTLDQGRVEIEPGERIQIVGTPGAGKSTVFRALAGMWPWGGGTIHLPPRDEMMFMPQRPYLPLGTLRAAVSYPDGPERFDDAAVRAALERVDLGHLVPLLDRTQRWDRQLTLDEQQRLAFARLLLHEPRWVVLDDAVGALDEEHRRLVLSIFERELASATVIHFGRNPVLDCSWDRTLRHHRATRRPLLPCRPAAGDPDGGRCPHRHRAERGGRGTPPPARPRRMPWRREGNERDERYRCGRAPRPGRSRMAAPGGARACPQAPSARPSSATKPCSTSCRGRPSGTSGISRTRPAGWRGNAAIRRSATAPRSSRPAAPGSAS